MIKAHHAKKNEQQRYGVDLRLGRLDRVDLPLEVVPCWSGRGRRGRGHLQAVRTRVKATETSGPYVVSRSHRERKKEKKNVVIL